MRRCEDFPCCGHLAGECPDDKATSDMPDGWADIEKKRERIDMIAAAHQRSLKTI